MSNIFENEITWLFICLAVMVSIGIISYQKTTIEQEKTKQVEIQLKMEMIKAGVTNIPTIHLDKP